jgi:hypothetical protein
MLADLGVSAVSASWGRGFEYSRSEVNTVEGGLFAPQFKSSVMNVSENSLTMAFQLHFKCPNQMVLHCDFCP